METGMDVGNRSDYHYKVVESHRENEALRIAIRGAIAALSQNKTFPADIKAAKKWLRDALEN